MSEQTKGVLPRKVHALVRQSGMHYIRNYYGVPAKRGARVLFNFSGQLGTITGARNGRLLVRFDGNKRSQQLHPTWEVEYLPNSVIGGKFSAISHIKGD